MAVSPGPEAAPADADAGLNALLDYVRQARGFDFTGYKRPSLTRRIKKRMLAVRADGYPDYQALLEAAARRVRPALRHDPDQRHRLPPRPRRLGPPGRGGDPPPARRPTRRRAHPGVVGRLRVGPGGVLAGDAAVRRPRRGPLPGTGQALRHRRRRRRPRPGPPGPLPPQGGVGEPGRDPGRAVLRGRRRRHRVPQGPAPVGDLRAPRPAARPADLARSTSSSAGTR